MTWSQAQRAVLKHPDRLVWQQGWLWTRQGMSEGQTPQCLFKPNLAKVSNHTSLSWINVWLAYPGIFFTIFKVTEQCATCLNIYWQVFASFSQTWHKKKFDFSPVSLTLHSCFASHCHIFTAKYYTDLSGTSLANTPSHEVKQSLMVLAKCSIIHGVHIGEKISYQKKVSSGHITFAALFYSRIMAFGQK